MCVCASTVQAETEILHSNSNNLYNNNIHVKKANTLENMSLFEEYLDWESHEDPLLQRERTQGK